MTSFHRLSRSTLIAVYVLILVGGIVRSTGSGMGCPDWPRCFGEWIPPSSISELPADYKEKYSAIRDKKNQKFAKYLSALGFEDTANRILTDKSILVEADFSPVKSWIEYFNRLVGVVIGFFIMVLAYRSIRFRKTHPWIFRISVAALLAVIVQGWFGSIVVSTNLTTWTVTVHMFLALFIVVLLLYLFHASSESASPPTSDRGVALLTAACMFTLLVQIFFGTEVRSGIDRVAASLPRSGWLKGVGMDFIVHRSFSWTVMVVHLILLLKLRKTVSGNPLSLVVMFLILGAFLSGAGMFYFDMPSVLQPLHLLLATMTFGAEMLLLLRLTFRVGLNGSSV